eukprot:2675694-Rhodomonas_salina.2
MSLNSTVAHSRRSSGTSSPRMIAPATCFGNMSSITDLSHRPDCPGWGPGAGRAGGSRSGPMELTSRMESMRRASSHEGRRLGSRCQHCRIIATTSAGHPPGTSGRFSSPSRAAPATARSTPRGSSSAYGSARA